MDWEILWLQSKWKKLAGGFWEARYVMRRQVPSNYGPNGPGLLRGWEALGTSVKPFFGEPMILGATALAYHREDGIHMKNTGKRIFFTIAAFGLANLAIVVSAGAFTSQR